MITKLFGHAQLVDDANRVEMPNGDGEGDDPHREGTHERKRCTVEPTAGAEEREPTLLPCWVEIASSEHTSEQSSGN